MDGTTILARCDMTVREARRTFTPKDKICIHLDLCYLDVVLSSDEEVGARALQGVWRKVDKLRLSHSPEDDPHLWRPFVLADGTPTEAYVRIRKHGFHLRIEFEGSLLFSKITRGTGLDGGYEPSNDLELVCLSKPNPGPSSRPEWGTLYIDRVWVSRDVEFWAKPKHCLHSCGVGPGTVLTAHMERLDLNHETSPGDPEERRARIRETLKRKREMMHSGASAS